MCSILNDLVFVKCRRLRCIRGARPAADLAWKSATGALLVVIGQSDHGSDASIQMVLISVY